MARQLDKATFLESLRSERERWEAVVAEVGEERMDEPGAEGQWSVKDVIAHVTWHEREMVEMLRQRSLGSASDLWVLPTHERNAAIYEQNRDRTLEDVLNESQQMFPQLLREAEALSNADLHDPGRFVGMPGDWVPWKIVAENSYEHYRDHATSLRAWLAQKGK